MNSDGPAAYAASTAPQENDFVFYDRSWQFIPDSNNGSYSSGGNILFDLGQLSGSGRFIDFSQSYLTIPLVLQANFVGPANAGAPGLLDGSLENVFAASLKNIPSLFHSLQVNLSSCEVVQNASFSNLDINYRILTSSSQDAAATYLPSISFVKDSVDGYDIQNFAGNVGSAIEANNVITGRVFTPSDGFGSGISDQNTGRLERMMSTSFSAARSPQTVAQDANGNPTYAGQIGKDYCTIDATPQNITYFVLATIPLKILHPFFEALPLCKSPVVRINLYLNAQCRFSSTLTRGAAVATVYPWTYETNASITANGTLPFMLSPISSTFDGTAGTTAGALAVSRGLTPANAATVSLNATLGIGRNLAGTVSHPTMTQARIHICQRTMSPIWEEQYFSAFPQKTIMYEDRTSAYVIPAVAAGGSVIQLINNGLSRLRRLVIFPKLTTGSTVGGNAVAALDTWQSPFTSSPCTTAPKSAFVANFQVIVSGTNVYREPQYYGWQHFLQQVKQSGNLNGGHSLSMQCGLLSQSDWMNGYGFIVTDLAHMADSQAADDVARSVTVQLTNATSMTLDYYCVLIYQKQLQVSTQTGTLIQ